MYNDIAIHLSTIIYTDASRGLDINLSVAVETDLLQSSSPGATVWVLQHQGAPESCNKKVKDYSRRLKTTQWLKTAKWFPL